VRVLISAVVETISGEIDRPRFDDFVQARVIPLNEGWQVIRVTEEDAAEITYTGNEDQFLVNLARRAAGIITESE
jgi:hypothetical protein